MASWSAQRFEVRSLSASNLPNVRKLKIPGRQTKFFVVVRGPARSPYRTVVCKTDGFNPRWDDHFTILLQPEQPNAVLEFHVWISRSIQRKKWVGKAQVPVADFSGPNEDWKVYPIECTDHHGADAQLTISAKLKHDEGASSSTSGEQRNGQISSPSDVGKSAGVPSQGKSSAKLSTEPSESSAQTPKKGKTSPMNNIFKSGATTAASIFTGAAMLAVDSVAVAGATAGFQAMVLHGSNDDGDDDDDDDGDDDDGDYDDDDGDDD